MANRGRTPFDGMSHATMLAWLDRANASAVQDAADRLAKAAEEIHKIAADLKVRPQWVEWKGEGADAFRKWGADLHNQTLRLGDYSDGASKWLASASNAIALAKSTIPRTLPEEAANLAAATKYRNDPDSVAIRGKAVSTLPHDYANATPEAKEAAAASAQVVAADRMRVLAESYVDSQENMEKLERPVFPPPPGGVLPEGYQDYGRTEETYRRGDNSSYAVDRTYDESTRERTVSLETVSRVRSETDLGTDTTRPVERPVDMEIDSVATLPDTHAVPPTTGTVPPGSRPEVPGIVPPGVIPPTFGGRDTGLPSASAPGRALPSARGVVPPGQAGINSRMPREGIVGGRPVVPNTGRPTGGIPRGTVIGNEGTTARGPMGRGGMAGMHGGGPMGGVGQSGISGGRRLASEAGGVVGGRPQQAGQNGARPFTPGGSGLVRGANPNSNGGAHPGQAGRAGAIPPGSQSADSRRDERNGERPDYLSEDEETWQQGSRRVVPPVID